MGRRYVLDAALLIFIPGAGQRFIYVRNGTFPLAPTTNFKFMLLAWVNYISQKTETFIKIERRLVLALWPLT
jgi:hypothetical protein